MIEEYKPIPGGSIYSIRIDPLKLMQDAAKKYGDLCCIKRGKFRLYIANDPAIVKELLLTKHMNFSKGSPKTKKIVGDGILTSSGDFHHKQKRLMQPAFHQQQLASYATIMTDFAGRVTNEWKDGQELDVRDQMMRLTMGIVAKCLYSADVESDWKEVAKALYDVNEYLDMLSSPFAGVLDRLPLPVNRRFRRALQELDAVIYKIIEQRRNSTADSGDLLSTLLKAQYEEGGGMTNKQLRDETMSLFLAGHETTANVLTWALYLLSQNPSVEEKLLRELARVLPGRRIPTAEDVPKLSYTTKVFTETLRLYPPIWRSGRIAINDYFVRGYLIPAGSLILFSHYMIQRDPRYYDNPEQFNPDRWTPEMEANLPDFAFFPFGGGPRSCIGEPFAKMESIMLIAAIAQNWKMTHDPNHKAEIRTSLTLRPKYGMMMKLSKR